MKYTAEEVRDYADACRLAHKGPVIADMLTELAKRIKADESAAPVGFVMEATATRHKFGLLTQELPPGAELFTHPPAQAAQGEANRARCIACGRATDSVCDGLNGNGLGCTNAQAHEAPDGWRATRDNHTRVWTVHTPSGDSIGIFDRAAGPAADVLRQLARHLAAAPHPGDKPFECSGDPSSCPDNEGRGCYCSDARREGEPS